MTGVLANTLDYAAETGEGADGRRYPWYLLPFSFPYQGQTKVWDPFVTQRGLYNKLTPNKNSGDWGNQEFIFGLPEFIQLVKVNPAFAAHQCGVIRDKDAKVVPFRHWNLMQRELYWAWAVPWFLGHPVRIIILKARQQGASTWAEWMIFWGCALQEDACNQQGFIMAHVDKSSKAIFRMTERFYGGLKLKLRDDQIPARQAHSGWQLVFGEPRRAFQNNPFRKEKTEKLPPGRILNSIIEVSTAAAKQEDRGFTINYCHLSEVAYWPNPEDTWTALAQSIPESMGSVCILESTANAAGDFWQRMWNAAVADDNGFIPVFSGWQSVPWRWASLRVKPVRVEAGWVRDCSRELPPAYHSDDPAENTRRRTAFVHSFNAEEQRLFNEQGLTLEQLYWRAYTIESKCAGDLDRFKREYPGHAGEAFRAAGRNVFRQEAVDYYLSQVDRRRHPPPLFRGNLDLDADGIVKLLEEPHGYTQLWVKPVPGRIYCLGVDPAGGENSTADLSSIQVLDVRSMEQVAHCLCPEGVRFLATQVQALARYYGNALVVCESTGLGEATLTHLGPNGEFAVDNLYVREDLNKTEHLTTRRYGFHTNKRTKPRMIGLLRDLVNAQLLTLHCYETVQQMKGYVRRDDGSYGKIHAKDSDDAVDALGLVLTGIDSGQLQQSFKLEGYKLDDPRRQIQQFNASLAALADHTKPLGGEFHPALGECC